MALKKKEVTEIVKNEIPQQTNIISNEELFI